jgi:beta-galactosidase
VLQVGFKKDEIKGKQLLHNNRPILIKGVCRHEHDERTGKALTEEGMLKDITLLKQLNFNAVRCSHYPNHTRWYPPPALPQIRTARNAFRLAHCSMYRL